MLLLLLSGAVFAVGTVTFGATMSSSLLATGATIVVLVLTILYLPLWSLAPLVIVMAAVGGIVRLELLSSGVSAETAGLLGQGRVVIAIALLAIIRLVQSGRSLRIPQFAVIAIGIYALGILLSAQVALARGTAAPSLLADVQRDLSYVIGGFLVGVIVMPTDSTTTRRLYQALAGVTITAGLLSVAFVVWQAGVLTVPSPVAAVLENVLQEMDSASFSVDRTRFPFIDLHPNGAALVFVALAAFIAPALLRSRRPGNRLLATLLTISAGAAVFTTQSRTGLLAFGLVAVSHVVIARHWSDRWRTILVLAIGLVLLIGSGRFTGDRALTLETENVNSRQEIWAEAFSAFADSPFLGNGYRFSAASRFAGQSTHNEYLGRLVDGGLIGAASFLLVLGVFVRRGWLLSRGAEAEAQLGIGLLSFMAALTLVMMANASWTDNPIVPIFSWMFFGMAAATREATGRPNQMAVSVLGTD